MQNKCGACQGFVPVNGNWDFNMSGDCACNADGENRNTRRSRCKQCERCEDERSAVCCEQNTYIRDTDDCGCKTTYRSTSHSGCSGRADCQCEACVQNRRRSCETCTRNDDGCDKSYSRANAGCGCDKADKTECANGCGRNYDHGSTCSRSGKNRGVGMMKGYMQEIDEIFQSESALRAGTLFPELHKPLNGYCPYEGNCGTCAQAAAFAAWELRLYLNTHPNDEEALKLFRKLCGEVEEENYATTFLMDECCSGGWSWVKNPWPWEYDCRCGD